MTAILWFRQDLRLADNPALTAAVAAGKIVPLYILDDTTPGDNAIGGAQRWWLHHSLTALDASLGGKLVLRRGDSLAVLEAVMAETGAMHIHATRAYEPWWQRTDSELGERLTLHDGNYLAHPDSIRTGGGGRYKIFTPYWRALLDRMPPAKPLPVPERIETVTAESDKLDDWHLLPVEPDWATGFDVWTPGEDGAKAAFRTFLDVVGDYDRARNMPSEAGTSRLSPHLHFGEISPATVWHHVAKKVGAKGEPYLREIGWRDYAANTIDQFPDYGTKSARDDIGRIAWRRSDKDFAAWTKGQTGYPIVDAGMRELWATGWMHNRVRMIAASFLVKHLLIDWRRGERWFWDTLVDADYGSNAVNWQWTAGSGVDSNMFVRIMAPLSQSEKFDAGDYIRKWVPELAKLPDATIHDPHGAGVAPATYAKPLVGHREGRERALEAYRESKA
ncbi:deoxyribodipyrimidine photo-lyase [Sphingomonas sp. SUN039]|uniref:cryptochrome/photolyase family protein n=1 Tax=Sphingomonas sp. SUN039 TaxID=2937787 RepID=UPI002164BA4A|nr:deoxyribodipyrimidine photo-lyase [Sphingomonas sp. SUN039]UVO53429.1 DNA photolyase family protein [Sphingomonas sp. SUN039]